MIASCTKDYLATRDWEQDFFIEEITMKEYMTIQEAAEKWDIGIRRVNTLCNEGRIEGVMKFGKAWAIPADAKKPSDSRIRSGKYIKVKN